MIIVTAILTRLYGLNLELLSPEQKASVITSALLGMLSVVGLYLLVKELFDEKIAAISSFLLAISSWHVLVSRIGATEIFTSFALIFAFYFIWHGLKYSHTFDFLLAGLFGGAGFYAGRAYFVAPLVALLVFWNYWDYIKKDFSLSKYEHVKREVLCGFALLVITVIAVALPVGFYVWQSPDYMLSTNGSVFANTVPATFDVESFTQIFQNIRWMAHKILLIEFDNGNLLSWPLIIFFAIGFIKEFVHWLKKKHGHFSVVHTFIFSWLFIIPVPVLLAKEPSILSLSIILPPILILSAKGLWWVIEKLNKWEHLVYPRPHKHWSGLNAGPFLAMLALLVSIALLEIF